MNGPIPSLRAALAKPSPPPFAWRRDRVVFPALDVLRLPRPLRNVSCCALLRLPDERIRFLRATGVAWDDERLDAAERMLVSLDDEGPAPSTFVARLRWELGIPALEVAHPVLDGADSPAWDLQRTALAVATRDLCLRQDAHDPVRVAAEVRLLERRFRSELDERVAVFVADLDAEGREAASTGGHLDIARYNFLVRGARRAWRRQFAQSFPLLVQAAATGGRDSPGARIRATVDAGVPLVRHLAARWGVSPGALRCLIGRPVDLVGSQWQSRPHKLVRILDVLRSEDRPRDDPEHWRRLAHAVTVAEEIFRRPATSSPLVLGWLRDAARRGFAALEEERRGRRLLPEAVPLIDTLRTAAIAYFHAVACPERTADDDERRIAIAAIADHHLAPLSPARLADIAATFARERASHRAVSPAEVRPVGRERFWPLLPRDFVAMDGALRVTPLTTLDAIRDEGRAQELCIADGFELLDISQECADGCAYLLSVRDATTGRSLSTVEVEAHRPLGAGRIELRVRQHKARGNARPSAGSVRVLREALQWAASREVQEHLDEGRRLAALRRKATPAGQIEADRIAVGQALRIALGETLYETLARACADVERVRRDRPLDRR